jgi:hypothetical protein
LLSPARVRSSPLLLAAIALAAACAPVRRAYVQAPIGALPVPPPVRFSCFSHPLIDRWEGRLRSERRFRAATAHVIDRGAPHLARLRAVLAEAGLPPGLALLPAIESSFRTDAVGPRGSAGLWQLQPATARRFGLVVSRARDERFDPELSTWAAVRYLRLLYDRYGDWPLALAAYNAGEGRVDRALGRGSRPSFWSLAERPRLPQTSRDYVARFLALLRVAEEVPAC